MLFSDEDQPTNAEQPTPFNNEMRGRNNRLTQIHTVIGNVFINGSQGWRWMLVVCIVCVIAVTIWPRTIVQSVKDSGDIDTAQTSLDKVKAMSEQIYYRTSSDPDAEIALPSDHNQSNIDNKINNIVITKSNEDIISKLPDLADDLYKIDDAQLDPAGQIAKYYWSAIAYVWSSEAAAEGDQRSLSRKGIMAGEAAKFMLDYIDNNSEAVSATQADYYRVNKYKDRLQYLLSIAYAVNARTGGCKKDLAQKEFDKIANKEDFFRRVNWRSNFYLKWAINCK